MNFRVCRQLAESMSQVIIGKSYAIELLLVSLLAGGHALIEDVPGVGKTLLAKSLAKSIGGTFKRVQFTPDLLPADITGFNIFNQQTGEFVFHPGPVMTHVLLADEINRTVPRTQASLLESMAEYQITVDGHTMQLPRPFFVMATQNPIELEGTFPLPEAQLDRFLVRISLGYPDLAEEMAIMDRFRENDPLETLAPVISPSGIIKLQELSRSVKIALPVKEYIASIVTGTRGNNRLQLGSSPRGSLALMRSAQALCALRDRDFVLPDDIKYLAGPVLAHRVMLTDREKLKGTTTAEVINDIIRQIPVPIHG